jgi:hypothetical protein
MRLLLTISAFLITVSLFGQNHRVGEFYNGSNHLKSKGLSYKLRTPLGFSQYEADRPHIVQKWILDNPDRLDNYTEFQIMVDYHPNELKGFSKDDWENYLKHDNGMHDWVQGMSNVTDLKYYVIDGYPSIYYETSATTQRLDMTVTFYMITVVSMLENHTFSVNIMSANKNQLDDYKSLYDSICNSVVLMDQWQIDGANKVLILE